MEKEKIYLTVSDRYCSHWTVFLALRELLQNTLDVKNRQINIYRGKINFNTSSKPLELATLMMGETSKADNSDTVGQYGEGYKLAALVLLREGKKLYLANGYDHWDFSIEKHPIMDVDCLTVTITKNVYERPLRQDLSISFGVEGLTEAELEEFKDKTIYQRDLDIIAKDESSTIFETPDEWRSPRVFVGGVFIQNCSTLPFSVDIAPTSGTTLNRDRDFISNGDIGRGVGETLAAEASLDRLAKIIGTRETYLITYSNDFKRGVDERLDSLNEPEVTQFKNLVTDYFAEYEEDRTELGKLSIPIDDDLPYKVGATLGDIIQAYGCRPVAIPDNMYSFFDISRFPNYMHEVAKPLERSVEDELEAFFSSNEKKMRKEVKSKFRLLLDRIQVS